MMKYKTDGSRFHRQMLLFVLTFTDMLIGLVGCAFKLNLISSFAFYLTVLLHLYLFCLLFLYLYLSFHLCLLYSHSPCFLHLPFTFSPPLILTCRNKKSCSACLSLCSLSSCSWRSRGSFLMTSPRRGPMSCAEVDEEDEEEEDSPWCSLSSSSVSSG